MTDHVSAIDDDEAPKPAVARSEADMGIAVLWAAASKHTKRFFIAGFAGGAVLSLGFNNFFGNAGLIDGAIAHGMVGTAAGACTVVGNHSVKFFGKVAVGLCERIPKAQKYGENLVYVAAALASIYGGLQGYSIASQMLNEGVGSFNREILPAPQRPQIAVSAAPLAPHN